MRPYQRTGGALRAGVEEEVVLSLITQRLEAKRDREYKMADTIQVNMIYIERDGYRDTDKYIYLYIYIYIYILTKLLFSFSGRSPFFWCIADSVLVVKT